MIKKYDGLLNLEATRAKELFLEVDHPWEVLPMIKDFILKTIPNLDENYLEYSENVYIHKSVTVSDKATIIGPTIIGEDTEIRPGAYIRGNALIGKNCVIGNSTEVKNVIIFDNCQCPHYNYVADSILGHYAHTGAGVILSNLKNDKTNIKVSFEDEPVQTSLRKFSAILGDHTDIGCNSVICPGTVIFPNTWVYPLTMVRGVIPADSIVKSMDNIVRKEKR